MEELLHHAPHHTDTLAGGVNGARLGKVFLLVELPLLLMRVGVILKEEMFRCVGVKGCFVRFDSVKSNVWALINGKENITLCLNVEC